MIRGMELSIFLSVAVFLHLSIFVVRDVDTGGDAGGSGGEAFVTLAGSAPQIEQVMALWEHRPETHATLPQELETPNLKTPDAASAPAFELDTAPQVNIQIAAMPVPEQPRPDVPSFLPAPTPPMSEPIQEVAPEIAIRDQPTDTRPVVSKSTLRPKSRPQTADLAQPEQAPPPMAAPEPAPPPPPKTASNPAPKPAPDKKKATQTTRASAGAASQTAAGTGGTSHAGTSGGSQSLGKKQKQKLISVWASKIRSRIERNKRSPKGARTSGTVHLRIRVSRSGQLVSAKISKSSGVPALDKAALTAVKNAGRFAKAPSKLTDQNYGFKFSLKFKR